MRGMYRFISAVPVAMLATLLLTMSATAQQPTWRTFSTSTVVGLPINATTAMTQSSDGRLWVGTEAGLRYFFGGSFHTETAMPTAVLNDGIHILLATADGILWVGTAGGLYRRWPDGSWDQQDLMRKAGLQTSSVDALFLDSRGMVWVGGQEGDCGLAKWDGAAWKSIMTDNGALCTVSLAEDLDGRIWVADPVRIHVLQSDRLVKTVDVLDGLASGAPLRLLWRDTDGDMWLATGAGLVRFAGLNVSRIWRAEDGLKSSSVYAIQGDGLEGLWVGTDSSLVHLDEDSVHEVYTKHEGLAGQWVRSLLRDREGNLWVGTDDGISYSPIGSWAIEGDVLVNRLPVNAILVGSSGGDYLATGNGVLHRAPNATWSLLNKGLPAQTVTALSQDHAGIVWAGTSSGLAWLDDQQWVAEARVPATTTVTALLPDNQGALWVGTYSGLYRLTGSTRDFYDTTDGVLGQSVVLSIWKTRAGNIWVGTLNGGASCLCQGRWAHISRESTQRGLVDNTVLAGLEDSSGNLWFGTSMGLSRLQAGAELTDLRAWHTFADTLLGVTLVNSLWEDVARPAGNVWVGTRHGLCLIKDNDVGLPFTREDGLSDDWVYRLGQGANGALWIGTGSGLTYHRDAMQIPLIQVDTPEVDGTRCDQRCLSGVSYRSKTVVFNYMGSDLGDLDGLRYRYSLVFSTGSGPAQVEKGLTAASLYSKKLVSGTTYTFTVSALDRDFNESADVTRFLRVDAMTPWDSVRDSRFFPVIGLGVILLSLIGGARGYLTLRQRFRYPYLDLKASLCPTEVPETYQVRIHTTRGPRFLAGFRQRFGGLSGWAQGITPSQQVLGPVWEIDSDLEKKARRLSAGQSDELLFRHTGELLYARIFSPAATTYLKQHLSIRSRVPRLRRKGVRLRLCLEAAPECNDLPWELLYEEQIGFLGRRSDLALVRYVEPAEEWKPQLAGARLRILVVMAQPDNPDIGNLDLRAEKTRLDNIAQREQSHIELEYLFGVNAAQILGVQISEPEHLPQRLEAQLTAGWDVVHFVGHAGQDLEPREGEGDIVLWCEDNRGGYQALGPDRLRSWLQALSLETRAPKVVVLNACRTADVKSRLIQALLDGGVGAVIGMQWPMQDVAASAFTEGFYGTLVRHGQVDHAVSMGRSRIAANAGSGERDWAAPVLVMQTANGLVFRRE
jgi:ligand-binding sensor domain-containing protein/CHAT domain-containing protein